ncbi:MAG: hypothetical protein JNL42_23250 [Anaerolineae bacterium]|nr:hypothetical protein [Anaerolineae bacterium]
MSYDRINFRAEDGMDASTPYFSKAEHQSLHSRLSASDLPPSPHFRSIIERMNHLQFGLSRRLSMMGSDLQPSWERKLPVSTYSFASGGSIDGLAFAFSRPRAHAALIEKLMGRSANLAAAADPCRHPVLEVRLDADQFVVELIMSPLARWDQRNIAGKMRVERHREGFRSLLRSCPEDMIIGFWHGEALQDAFLTSRQILRGRFLEEWFGTFAAEHEWLRIGVWRTPEHPNLAQDRILTEVFGAAAALARIYQFFAWSSENDFHSFLGSGKKSANAPQATV